MKRMLMMLAVGATSIAAAQKPPAIRQIGHLEHSTTDSLASVRIALPMRNGSVLVHDGKGRRIVLFDSTLAHPVLVADTTDATNKAYGRSLAELFRYRGDSALFVDVGSLSMMVVNPDGKLGRVMAIPQPDEAQRLLEVFGLPGFDARGRLIYTVSPGLEGYLVLCCVEHPGRRPEWKAGAHEVPKPDSALLLRVDLTTRAPDTIGSVKVERHQQRIVTDDQGYVQSLQRLPVPLQIVDSWTVMSDGTLAVVRGRDYHIDWLGADGRWTSSTKMAFDWVRLDDERKAALLDSSAKAQEAVLAQSNARRASAPAGAGGGRGGGAGGGSGRGGTPIPEFVVRANIADLPDYVPAIDEHAVIADAENNLWIRTSTRVDGRPVYDIVNRRGELFDRVQLPPYRSIAGFGAGVIYMSVQDATGRVHLERARIRQELR